MAKKIYELKISLMYTYPSIYRTIQVEEDMTFYELSMAIKVAFESFSNNQHMFIVGDKHIGMAGDDYFDNKIINERNIKLSQIGFIEKDKFTYNYIFHDDWIHQIKVMKILEPKNTFYPKCVNGARNSPPNGCGGASEFYEFKEIMGDEKHPEFKETKEWYGGMYDEDLFVKKKINEAYKNFNATIDKIEANFDT